MSCSADVIKDGKVNFKTQPSLNKSGLRVFDNRESDLTYVKIQRHYVKELTVKSRYYRQLKFCNNLLEFYFHFFHM